MDSITTYIGADGKSVEIAAMNNFHLVNALLKTNSTEHKVEHNDEMLSACLAMRDALKAEVLKRMDNRPATT